MARFEWEEEKFEHKFSTNEKFRYEEIPQTFRLSRLNSVEHIKPQSKKYDWKEAGKCEVSQKEGAGRIDCFGNLALVSQHLNSALSNDSENKKDIIQLQLNRGTIESLKMLIFYSNIQSSEEITLDYCEDHGNTMLRYLLTPMANGH